MEHLLKECADKLYALAGNPSISTDLAAQAAFISAVLNEKLNSGDLDSAAMLICSQVEQMEEISNTVSRRCPGIFENTPSDLFKEYFQIIQRAGKELRRNQKYSPFVSGETVIHRIWLGKTPSEENLKKVALGNLAVEKQWIDYKTERPVKAKKMLWTNNKAMLNNKEYYHSLCGSEIMDISSLFSLRSEYYQYVHNFLARDEFALASDILRFMILEQYGGLYLGFRWTDARTHTKKKFNPVRYSLIFYSGANAIQILLKTPQESLSKYARIKTACNPQQPLCMDRVLDSEITYCGHKHNYYFTHVLNNFIELYETAQKSSRNIHFKAYRTAKYKTVQDSLKLTKTSSLKDIPRLLRTQMMIELLKNPTINVGLLTNVLSFYQALLDLNYISISMRHLLINSSNCFDVKQYKHKINPFDMHVEELGIGRLSSESWLTPDLKGKLSVEK